MIAKPDGKIATFSPCRRFRYTLWRDWEHEIERGLHFTFDPHPGYHPGRPDEYVQFIGLNPSTADEVLNDPTVTRCMNYAKAWGFGAFCMTNIFAFRQTDPKEMKKAADPVGPMNDAFLLLIAKSAALTIAAWGNDGEFKGRARHVRELFKANGHKLHALKITKEGHPWHPLYLRADLQPIPFD